jgi:hypothetical protein
MKKLVLTALAVVCVTGMVMAQKSVKTETVVASTANVAMCTWDKTSHNFGSIPQGKPVTVTYQFTNSGTAPLVIAKVSPSCGCTTDDYTKESIAPGKKGYVKLTYNAATVGAFTKSATVITNAQTREITLQFNGEVTSATN